MRLLIDGIAFQRSGVAAADWRPVLEKLAQHRDVAITLLDRGGAPIIDGIAKIPFPSHRGREHAADALLLQQLCDLTRTDVFTTTGATTPLDTPMALLLPAGAHGFDAGDIEAEATVHFAQHYVCMDAAVARALDALCPGVPKENVALATPDPQSLAAALAVACRRAADEAANGLYAAFFVRWRRLREIQNEIDFAGIGSREAPPIRSESTR